MAAYPGTLYLCLVGIATAAALVCVVFAGEVRLDACLWLAIAFVASVPYFVTRTAGDAGETITQPSRHLPQAGAGGRSRRIAPGPTRCIAMPEALKIDRLDLRILAQLQKNGRMTNVDLADAVGLSPSPCLIRVKRLEQAGYIAGYGAQLRLEKLGDTLTVFTEVTLSDHHREDFTRFEAAIREVDEILECHLVSGGYDYLLRFLTRGVNHYQEIIEELLERNIGIAKYFSYIVIKSPFIKTHCPIERLFPHQR